VDVFVNGNLIPFPMKIGEAGEAFFVFETDEDIPEDIVTSPLLEATKPGETNAHEQPTGRFGAKNTDDDFNAENEDLTSNLQEPEFLDLNADPTEQSGVPSESPHSSDSKSDPAPSNHSSKGQGEDANTSSILSRTTQIGNVALGLALEVGRSEKDKLKDKNMTEALQEVRAEEQEYMNDRLAAARSFSPSRYIGNLGSERGDEVLPKVSDEDAAAPEVHYGHGRRDL
jgi:phosphatidate phosphatase LPIN